MYILKMLHILFMIIWVGQLLFLTRFLGYSRKTSPEAFKEMIPLCVRMYFYIELPSMLLALSSGILLLAQKTHLLKMPYFHLKLTLVSLLVLTDLYLGKSVYRLRRGKGSLSPLKYKVLHSIPGLFLIAILWAIYVWKPLFMYVSLAI